MKKFIIIIILILITAIGFSMMCGNNITVYDIKKTTVQDDEYSIRFRAMIMVTGLTKKDFEAITKKAFESRQHSIRKYKLNLNADGCYPEYRLTMVEAKSIEDINEVLNEIDNYKNKNFIKEKVTEMNSNVINIAVIEKLDCYYDIETGRAKEFELTLKELTDARDIHVFMRGKPYTGKTPDGRDKTYFNFTLQGESDDIEEVVMELDRIFEDPYEDRD